jgi:hypothetical protein
MVGDGKVKSMLGGGSWKKKHEEKYVLIFLVLTA